VMPGQVVLLLLLTLGAAISAPLTDREKQNRIVAVSQSDASLLSAAVSKASPDLLRVALTAAEPDLLQTALTASDPDLLIAALNNVDPDLLAVALTKSEKNLLTTALTEAKVELLRTALNAPTNSAILEVALTHSTPELLRIALQDATVENLIVALTAADGSAGTASGQSASARLRIKDQVDTVPAEEDNTSRKSDKESSVSKANKIEESSNSKLASDIKSPASAPSPGFDSYPAVPDQEYQVPSHKIERKKKPTAGSSDGALSLSNTVPTTLGNIENETRKEYVDPQQDSGRPYGALSNSVQTRLGNRDEYAEPIKPYLQEVGRPNGAQSLSSSVQTRLGNREEYAQPINPYKQEIGRASGALSLPNPGQARLGNTVLYHEPPVTGSGGYSYNSGWSGAMLHQATLGRPGHTFPIYVPGQQQIPIYL